MPVYRYVWNSLALTDLVSSVPGSPVIGATGPLSYVDVTVPLADKADLDDYMTAQGYSFDSTDPVITPAEAAYASIPQVSLAAAYATAASYSCTLAFANIPFTTTSLETDASIVDHLAASNTRIQVFEAGTYQVSYGWYCLSSVNTALVSGQVMVNDTTAVAYSGSVSSNYANEGSNNTATFPVTLAAGDYVTVQAMIASGTGDCSRLFFSVTKMGGLKGATGATGATGSGSNIIVKENNTSLANTPHSTLNFGPGVTAVDQGGGVAQVTLDAYPSIGDAALTTPTVPTSGSTLFSRFRSGRHMAAQVGPSGMDYTFQPSLFGNKISWWSANGNTTVASLFNYVATATGTATLRTVATTNFATSLRRIAYVSTGTAGSSAGMRYAAGMWWRGNATGLGGFHSITRFTMGAIVANMRAFIGMSVTTGALANVDPSTLFNLVGLALDAGDANWQFIYNDVSGAATKVSLGNSWPRPTAISYQVYEFRLFIPPNGGTFYWSLENLDPANRAVIEGDSTLVPANIPSVTTLLCPQVWVNNATTASAVAVDVISQYIETDA